jgi:hypothetical protein
MITIYYYFPLLDLAASKGSQQASFSCDPPAPGFKYASKASMNFNRPFSNSSREIKL